MDRRRFTTFATLSSLLGPAASRAQPAGTVARIGLLQPSDTPAPRFSEGAAILLARLKELGWTEGSNLQVETRWAGVHPDRQRRMAAELKAAPVAVIVTPGTPAIRAARDGAPGVPIVMVNAGDPVGAGLVASLGRPGGNLTGTSASGEEVMGKQVELLAAAVPGLKRIGVLMNPSNPANAFFFDAMTARAKALGVPLDRIDVAADGEIDAAIARARGGALLVVADPMFYAHRARLTALAIRHQVPTLFGGDDYVAAGGLMSYLSSGAWHWRTAADIVDKILKGARPAEIPVAQPTEFKLAINLRTAKALGITFPPSLLLRADEKIQ